MEDPQSGEDEVVEPDQGNGSYSPRNTAITAITRTGTTNGA